MSGPKLFFLFQMTVTSLPVSTEILKIIRRLEENKDILKSDLEYEIMSRSARAPHIENQLYHILHKMRKSHHQKSNRNLSQYLSRERHKVATVNSPHHRRHSKNQKNNRLSPRPRNTG